MPCKHKRRGGTIVAGLIPFFFFFKPFTSEFLIWESSRGDKGMGGGENSGFAPSKGILHQQHLPDIVCLVPMC